MTYGMHSVRVFKNVHRAGVPSKPCTRRNPGYYLGQSILTTGSEVEHHGRYGPMSEWLQTELVKLDNWAHRPLVGAGIYIDYSR